MNGASINKFRNKTVEIEAMLFNGSNVGEVIQWLGRDLCEHRGGEGEKSKSLLIITPEGARRAEAGDWIIKGVCGEVYPFKPDLFEAKFEAV